MSNEADLYYIGGLRLQWNLAGLYTLGKEKEVLETHRLRIDTQRDGFLLNTQMALVKEQAAVAQLEAMLATDALLIAKREEMQQAAVVQLEHGLLSALDFINYLTATNKARQNEALHTVQWLMAQYNIRVTTGN
ncbi:MAG: hypothetical protein R2795_23460 [Saprospiraceae bacterium]